MEVRGCYMGGWGGGVDEVSRKNGRFAKHLMVCSLPWAPLQETLTFTGNKINQFPKKPIYSISCYKATNCRRKTSTLQI